MRVQLLSDVHSELYPARAPPEREADILILAGDIGVLGDREWIRYLDQCAARWDHVVMVAGNHEYYNSARTMRQVETRARALCDTRWTNVHWLHHQAVELQGWLFYGLVGWTPVSPGMEGEYFLSDYRRIATDQATYLTPATQSILADVGHRKLCAFLQTAPPTQPIVLITHFAPRRWDPIPPEDPLSDYFAWNDWPATLAALPGYRNIRAWCFGHTHEPRDEVQDDIRFLSRPVGYDQELVVPVNTHAIDIA
jgi:predicted phosphodiesterase